MLLNLYFRLPALLKVRTFGILRPDRPEERRSSEIQDLPAPLYSRSLSVPPSFVPFAPIKIHAEHWVVVPQTHTAQFGLNLIPPGPANSISDP